jgi:hypothetical protein
MKMIVSIGWQDYMFNAPAAKLEELLALLNGATPVSHEYIDNKPYLVQELARKQEFKGHTIVNDPITEAERDALIAAGQAAKSE